ncbi:uncharacterized protein LOC106653870 [Trichogramma pretiosum]|uniref:uncharacterized protein LOC106653870 n=1 Tax=Trichogramma pretiosum TaxID=7493 RepID=UPI0006C9B94E|nr:uncharacterized protein LOC106653870 [Trichogramma pretiosum]
MNGNSPPSAYGYHRRIMPSTRQQQQQAQQQLRSHESHYEALKDACLHRDRGTITWLLKEGCRVNDKELDRVSDSPLHVAVFNQDLELVRLLLNFGADVNATNFQKQTPVHLAFEMRNQEMVDLLLARCRDGRCNPFTGYGLSHFHIACVRNNWRVAHAYLENGVNANTFLEKSFYGRDYVFYRPLHLACKYENLEVAELLLKYGANVNARDRFQRVPLHMACRFNSRRLCDAVREAEIESPQDVLRLVKQEYGQVDIVRLLLRFHADVEALDVNDTPPLFHVFKCDMRLLRGIVATRVASYNEDFWREVQAVFRDIQREKFFCLINADANVGYATASGKDTLLHLLIDGRRLFNHHHQSGSSNKNNKINGCNNNNYSSRERDLPDEEKAELVDTLLKYGADKDARNSAGLSALQMAVSAYLRHTVKMLLDHGANVAGVCFFHYRMPKRDPSGNFDVREMEAFLDIIALMLARKSELGANRSNELLMLRYMAVESSIRHIENCSLSELRHLLDFGDVNAMNVAFYLSERSVLSNREKIGLMLEHIRKLEVAGLHVEAGVKRQFLECEAIIDARKSSGGGENAAEERSFTERCRLEVAKLKLRMIDRYASFYDLLFLNVNEVAVRIKNERFRAAIRDNCRADFVLYNAMIIKQFVKGLIRSILLEATKQQLSYVYDVTLPDPCSERIIRHLSNEDLCNLALAFERCF